MNEDFVFLVEKEELWAKRLIEALENNKIPTVYFPVYGKALSLQAWKEEILRIYVPKEFYLQATKINEELFNPEVKVED